MLQNKGNCLGKRDNLRENDAVQQSFLPIFKGLPFGPRRAPVVSTQGRIVRHRT